MAKPIQYCKVKKKKLKKNQPTTKINKIKLGDATMKKKKGLILFTV